MLEPSAGSIGAVAYLNMLPYFHLGSVPVFPTPRALNEQARAGALTAACTSAIAGLRAGWEPLVPLVGIGAAGAVRSVYVEPIPLGRQGEAAAWSSLFAALAGVRVGGGLLARGSEHRSPLVTLFTSGASEHSEWLACVLLESAGHPVRVVRDPALAAAPERTLRQIMRKHTPEGFAALLVIGDPALVRAARAPDVLRFDLAEAWRAATGLPCVFAAWFACGRGAEEHAGAAMVLERSLSAWEALPSAGRRACIAWFLAEHVPTLRTDLPSAFAAEAVFERYLEGITYRFNGNFAATLALYADLLAQGAGAAAADSKR